MCSMSIAPGLPGSSAMRSSFSASIHRLRSKITRYKPCTRGWTVRKRTARKLLDIFGYGDVWIENVYGLCGDTWRYYVLIHGRACSCCTVALSRSHRPHVFKCSMRSCRGPTMSHHMFLSHLVAHEEVVKHVILLRQRLIMTNHDQSSAKSWLIMTNHD
jgi:hypothetical protein